MRKERESDNVDEGKKKKGEEQSEVWKERERRVERRRKNGG